jgi:hypothetical protein
MELKDYKETLYTVPTNGSQTWRITAEPSKNGERLITLFETWEELEFTISLNQESAQLLADVFKDIANGYTEGAK